MSLSSLLPRIPLTKRKIIGNILKKLISVVNNPDDVLLLRPSLERSHNEKAELKTSSSTSTSSIPDLCKSLDQVSLNFSNKSKLCENLKQIIKISEDCLKITTMENTSSKKISLAATTLDTTSSQKLNQSSVKLENKRKLTRITSNHGDGRKLGVSPVAASLKRRIAFGKQTLSKQIVKSDIQNGDKSRTLKPGNKIPERKTRVETVKLQKLRTFGNGSTRSTNIL